MQKCTTGTFLYEHATDSQVSRIFPSSCHTHNDQQFGAKGHLGIMNIIAVCKGTSRGNIQKDYA